jgi:GTPase SAR1 family protein
MSVPFVMNIWDTAGQEKFRSLTRSFYRGSGACILAFDLSMDTSLKNTYYWMEELKREWRDDIGIYVCGLKSDLYHVVDRSRGEEVANYLGGEYWECSAKTGMTFPPTCIWGFLPVNFICYSRSNVCDQVKMSLPCLIEWLYICLKRRFEGRRKGVNTQRVRIEVRKR